MEEAQEGGWRREGGGRERSMRGEIRAGRRAWEGIGGGAEGGGEGGGVERESKW